MGDYIAAKNTAFSGVSPNPKKIRMLFEFAINNSEKSLKRWRRQWKIDLIKSINPECCDLYRGAGW